MSEEQYLAALAILAKGVEETRIGDRMVRYDLASLQRQVNEYELTKRGGSQYRKVTMTRPHG